jgi:hypothetical protein
MKQQILGKKILKAKDKSKTKDKSYIDLLESNEKTIFNAEIQEKISEFFNANIKTYEWQITEMFAKARPK